MKDLIGYLKKTLLRFNLSSLYTFLSIIFFFTFFLLISTPSLESSSTGNFKMSADFEHTLTQESINTEVILKIESDTPRVISYYTATIPLEELKVSCKNFITREELDCTTYNRGSSTDVLVNLKNSVIRPESPLEVSFAYSTPLKEKSSYTLSSEIRDTSTNSVLIRYPKEMGEPLWSSDPIHNIRTVGDNFEVSIDKPTYTNISLLFGEQLLYKFQINKVFSNSLDNENQTFELYVPSDTSTQTIIWDEISPLPNTTLQDDDGNYIFKYIVAPDETLDCNISGYIQKTEGLNFDSTPKTFLTQSTGYWSISNSTEFRRINTYLNRKGLEVETTFDDVEELDDLEKELFYKYIYQYVTERLNLAEDITLGIGNHPRLGANTLVDSPNNATSIDYADFYIAILRKYNVPSRLVIGYISNITGYAADGFYHHWVEYLDTKENRWITADPFFEEHFEKNLFGSPFLDHIAIIKRGRSAVAPKLSFFQETDFTVRAETEEQVLTEFDITSEFVLEEYKSTEKYVKGYIHISNNGNVVINAYDLLKSNIPDISKYLDPVNNLKSQIVLPNQSGTLQLNIPYDEIESKNLFVNIRYRNLDRYKTEETLETQLEESVPMYVSILSKLTSLLVFSALLFLLYFAIVRFKRLIKKKQDG